MTDHESTLTRFCCAGCVCCIWTSPRIHVHFWEHLVITGRKYVHFNIQEETQCVLENEAAFAKAALPLQLHVDGFSPILGLIVKPKSRIFIIDLFSGMGKPKEMFTNSYTIP
ncbi:hypothetical protein FBUS_00470 [Fasciolopsis buskii]|uniref:Uncharacterized protein n=1 Tax=Fasciolopsis buskii TaxID=27845 RepID=A0A8E0S924_9TREM|nr:hypothetical protein FBUS_00470 [Fasciolopsis buski]